jgi:hypothetical protein
MVAASFVAVVAVLVSYAVMVRTGKQLQFDIVNVLANVPLVMSALAAGLVANAFLSGSFGLIGLWGVLRHVRARGSRDAPA